MSYVKEAMILCDGKGTDGFACSWSTKGGGYATAQEVRGSVKSEGWSYRNGKDYCPKHSKKQKEQR